MSTCDIRLQIVQTIMSCTACSHFFCLERLPVYVHGDMHSSYNDESMDCHKSSQALTITIAVAISYGLYHMTTHVHGLTLHLSLSIIVDMIIIIL